MNQLFINSIHQPFNQSINYQPFNQSTNYQPFNQSINYQPFNQSINNSSRKFPSTGEKINFGLKLKFGNVTISFSILREGGGFL